MTARAEMRVVITNNIVSVIAANSRDDNAATTEVNATLMSIH